MPPKKSGGSVRKKRGPKTSKLTSGASTSGGGSDVPLVEDERFRSQHWDPRFGRLPPRGTGGAPVDDERFKFKAGARKISRVDRFGRRKRTNAVDELSASEEEDDEDEGGYLGISSSDSESESDDGGVADTEQNESAQQYGRATKRVAVQGLDWGATRAVDIFACFASFGPGLQSVTIYPSKLGLQRLAAEERLGPQFIRDAERRMLSKARATGAEIREEDNEENKDSDSNSDSDDGSAVAMGVRDAEREKWRAQSALRKYEEERLKYYYGVAVFKDAESAEKIYDNCDGVEYGQSRCEFSLSFVPDEMVIDTPAREKCDRLPDGYTPPEIAPNTLSNTTVASTWDADAPDRLVLKRRVMRRKEADEDNLRAYIHSESEGDGDGEADEEIERKRKLLLGDLEDGNEVVDEEEGMVVTFNPEMLEHEHENDDNEKIGVEEDRDESHWEARMRRAAERKAEKKKRRIERIKAAKGEDENPNETPATFDDPFFTEDRSEVKRAQRAAKKRRRDTPADGPDETEKARQRAELELLMGDDKNAAASDDEGELETKRKKRTRGRRRADKQRAEERKALSTTAKFDVGDERFKALFESHRFALDPTHTKFKQDETTDAIRAEMSKRKQLGTAITNSPKEGAVNNKRNTQDEESNIMALAKKIKADARRGAKRRVR